MDHVRRVIVHDKPPILEPELLSRPASRLVLAAAATSVIVQIVALAQVIPGHGRTAGWFDHLAFAMVSALWLALGVLVFLQRRSARAGRLFLLSAAAGSMFLSLTTLYSENLADAALFATGLLFFPPFLLGFVRAFSGDRPWRREELLLYVPPTLLVAPGAQSLSNAHTTLLWRISLSIIGAYLVLAIVQALRDVLISHSAEQAAQSRALLFGLVAGTMPGILFFILPLVATGHYSVALGLLPPLILLFLIAMSYAVLLFEFSEADLIVRRGVVYGMLTLVIIVAYGVLGVLLAAGGTVVTSAAGGLGFVAVTLLVGAAFGPIRYAARRLADWVLYGRLTDRWRLLQALSARLAILMPPDQLGNVLVREIADALHLRGAFLLRRTGDSFTLRHHAGAVTRSSARYESVPEGLVLDAAAVEAALGDPPESVLIVHRKPATARHRGTLPSSVRVLDDLHAALSIPFITRSGLEAVLCLQPKLAHDAFDADDLELLAPVIRQATAALDNALLFARLEEKVEELRRAYRRIAREQEAERARLARELHDGTAQELAGLITLVAVAERQMDGEGGPARTTLDRLRQQAEDAYQGVRRASHALRPLMLDDFGLGPTLVRYLGQFQEATGIAIDYEVDEVGPLPDDVELALFRVTQECMENVRKHSGATQASLHLHADDGRIVLTVADAGRGMVERDDTGIGLAGMRERIEAVGGMIRVQSESGGGVTVEAAVPAGERWQASVLESS